MAYQISEKNQILVALFAIVVLCAGKLFKDYLYRGGYVEGLTIIPSADRPLRRPAPGGSSFIATLYLNLTLGAALAPTTGTITVSWPTVTGVTMSDQQSHYAAAIVTTGTGATVAAGSPSGTSVIFTVGGAQLPINTKLKISIANVIIAAGAGAATDTDINFNFTTITTTETTAVITPITILKSAGTTPGLADSTSAQEIRNAIASINTRIAGGNADPDLFNARSALVNVLAYTYGTVKEAGKIFDSDTLYEAQKTAINFIAKEKERSAANAKSLTDDNRNKRRMAQVNTYYTRNYEANTEVMKNIIYVSIALIVLALMRNKELIPASISTLGVIFILTMGGIVIGKQVFDIMRRNDHEFDKYDWNFNEDDVSNKFIQQTSDPSKPMDLGMGAAPCYGPGCCDVGTTWDAARGRCASSDGALSSQGSSAVWTKPVAPATTGTLTITMKISQALVSTGIADKVKITLPSGLFTATAPASITATKPTATTATTVIANPTTKTVAEIAAGLIELTATADVAASTTITITITGISVSPNADLTSYKDVRVATTKETTNISLRISGLV
jgi:hypothetical protein